MGQLLRNPQAIQKFITQIAHCIKVFIQYGKDHNDTIRLLIQESMAYLRPLSGVFSANTSI